MRSFSLFCSLKTPRSFKRLFHARARQFCMESSRVEWNSFVCSFVRKGDICDEMRHEIRYVAKQDEMRYEIRYVARQDEMRYEIRYVARRDESTSAKKTIASHWFWFAFSLELMFNDNFGERKEMINLSN